MQAAQPLEMIEARSLISRLTTASFLVDREGTLVFFNEPAAELLGISFEEAGAMEAGTWGTRFKPREPGGRDLQLEELPLAVTVQSGRPDFARMRITSATGKDHEIEVSAFPIMAGDTQQGSLAIFWPVVEDAASS
ncbi:MAG TPA: PAS domain-containing protein [Solirubrobacterales bacterium]|jgi:PAS domain-containing protein